MTKTQTPLFPQPTQPTKLQKLEAKIERLILGKKHYRSN